jgi:hypothetical protein
MILLVLMPAVSDSAVWGSGVGETSNAALPLQTGYRTRRGANQSRPVGGALRSPWMSLLSTSDNPFYVNQTGVIQNIGDLGQLRGMLCDTGYVHGNTPRLRMRLEEPSGSSNLSLYVRQ